MAPLTPHWPRPSHPEIQEVIINEAEFTSTSRSRVALPPFAVFAKMVFPPCTVADEPTYATVQIGRDRHLNLNSDLLYINHSCEPSLIFDTAGLNILAGPKGLKPGDELTFFYPSTEWSMAQPFTCMCGTPSCRGLISGAEGMTPAQLDGLWLNSHILQMLEEKRNNSLNGDGNGKNGKAAATTVSIDAGHGHGHGHDDDMTARAMRNAQRQAELAAEAAKAALVSYIAGLHGGGGGAVAAPVGRVEGAGQRGVTSREMSGEMGGDTTFV